MVEMCFLPAGASFTTVPEINSIILSHNIKNPILLRRVVAD